MDICIPGFLVGLAGGVMFGLWLRWRRRRWRHNEPPARGRATWNETLDDLARHLECRRLNK